MTLVMAKLASVTQPQCVGSVARTYNTGNAMGRHGPISTQIHIRRRLILLHRAAPSVVRPLLVLHSLVGVEDGLNGLGIHLGVLCPFSYLFRI